MGKFQASVDELQGMNLNKKMPSVWVSRTYMKINSKLQWKGLAVVIIEQKLNPRITKYIMGEEPKSEELQKPA